MAGAAGLKDPRYARVYSGQVHASGSPLPTTQVRTLRARLPGLASLLLAAALGIVLARLTWQLLTPAAPFAIAPTANSSPAKETAGALPRARPGLAVPLFGSEAQAPATTAIDATVTAPPTRLDLKLRGVAVAEDEALSWAIVEGADRQSLPYRPGDLLPGAAELLRVEDDRIVLRHQGALEALYFSDEPPPPAAEAARPVAATGTPAIQLSPQASSRIREYLSLLPSDPARMSELVRALPVMENGALKGFRLFPGQQQALFGETGLRRGDIVTRINGLPLDDPARGMDLLNQLASASRFQIELLRRGQPQVLDIQL